VLSLLSKTLDCKLMTMLNRFLCLVLAIGIFFATTPSSPVWAQTAFNGTFKLTKSCNATTSISGKNPVFLTVDETYEVVGLNKETSPTHAYIKFPGFGQRWVDLSCGKVSSGSISTDGTTTSNRANNSKFLPFFDNISNPVNVAVGGKQDLTPPPPQLNKFDVAINQICGEVGTVVNPVKFQLLLKDFPDVLANIKNYVGGSIVAGRNSDTDFLNDLSDIWFNSQAFDHVFCGEPEENKIGGLHFVGRYLDLQNRNLAGRLPQSDRKSEVVPDAIYSFGVVMEYGNRQIKSPMKGYGYTLNAEEILEIAAKAYKNNPISQGKSACLLNITDNDKTFTNVFVAKNGAIRTFYPDATPDFQGTYKCKV